MGAQLPDAEEVAARGGRKVPTVRMASVEVFEIEDVVVVWDDGIAATNIEDEEGTGIGAQQS